MELMTKKTLFAGVAGVALLAYAGNAIAMGGGGEGGITTVAVSAQGLTQVTTNIAVAGNVANDHSQAGGEGGVFKDFNKEGMSFGEHTFTHQVLDVNNFNTGLNSAQQGAISIAVSANFGDNGS